LLRADEVILKQDGQQQRTELETPPKVLRSFQNKSQIVTAPTVVKMICAIAYHRIS